MYVHRSAQLRVTEDSSSATTALTRNDTRVAKAAVLQQRLLPVAVAVASVDWPLDEPPSGKFAEVRSI